MHTVTTATPRRRGLLLVSTIVGVLLVGFAVIAVAAVGIVGWRAGWFSSGGVAPSPEAPTASSAAPASSPAELEGTWVMKLVATDGRMKTSMGVVEIPPEKLVEIIGITNRDTLRWQIGFRSGEGTIVETYASGREATVLKGVWDGRAFVIDTSTPERTGRREITVRDGALIGICSLRYEKLDVNFTVQGTRENPVGAGPVDPAGTLRPAEAAK